MGLCLVSGTCCFGFDRFVSKTVRSIRDEYFDVEELPSPASCAATPFQRLELSDPLEIFGAISRRMIAFSLRKTAETETDFRIVQVQTEDFFAVPLRIAIRTLKVL